MSLRLKLRMSVKLRYLHDIAGLYHSSLKLLSSRIICSLIYFDIHNWLQLERLWAIEFVHVFKVKDCFK